MKKPTKKPQITTCDSNLFDVSTEYTPQNLRDKADCMEEVGIISVEFELEGYDGYFECQEKSMETADEAAVRYAKEMKVWEKQKAAVEKRKEKEKKQLVKDAKRLGIKLANDEGV